jgi:hypothetical protein
VKDSTSVQRDVEDYTQSLNNSIKGLTIGLGRGLLGLLGRCNDDRNAHRPFWTDWMSIHKGRRCTGLSQNSLISPINFNSKLIGIVKLRNYYAKFSFLQG